MDDTELIKRIAMNPDVMVGNPVIKGSRLTVQFIVGLLAHGATREEILDEYPGISDDDINACLLFACKTVDNNTFLPLVVEPV